MIENSSNKSLPPEWKWVKLGEVCKLKNGFAFKSTKYKKEGVPVIRISDIKQGIVNPDNSVRVDALDGYEEYTIQKGDILVAMSGATTGKFGIFNSKEKAYQNQRVGKFQILNETKLNNNFLLYQLYALKREIEKDAYGGAQPNISSGKIESMKILLPPRETQISIVAKIEQLFSELDKGIENLKIAQQQLKTYRQSVLKWAFEGKLTNNYGLRITDYELDMAAERQANYLTILPTGWKWVKMGDICNKIGDIDHKMPKQRLSGYPYLSTKDFTDNLKVSFDNVKYISEEDYLNLSRKIKPEKGDIIFPRYGTIGKNILIDFDKEILVSYSCAVLKPNPDLVLSKYVYLYTLSPRITDEIRKYVVETTQANIGIASIKSFVFPLPSLEEQHAVVETIETRLSVADKIEDSINQSLQQAEVLRQSILKKAFEGKLL